MEEALIRVKDLCKIYNPGENEVRALDHINLEIKYPAPIQILQNRNLSFVRYQKYLLQS